jgi:predicted aminopeptidase
MGLEMSVILEDTDVLSALRILKTLFGVPVRDDAAAHAATQALIQQLQQQVQKMSDRLQGGLDALKADVAAQGTVIASATTAFQGLSQQLADALAAAKNAGATDAQLADLTAVQQGLEANTAALRAAIPQNTSAAGSEVSGTTPPSGTGTQL